MRTLAGVLLVLAVLVPLAAGAVRGVRRFAWTDHVEDAGRTTLQALVEGLIVLAVVIIGVVVVVAFVD